MFLLTCFGLLLAQNTLSAETAHPRIRLSAWYWLNSAPKADWAGDFVTMKNLGFTDVLLCWGLDLGGVTTRKTETKHAMQLAHQAGIGVYLIVWQPYANSMKRVPEFQQIDVTGRRLNTFDVFNPQWRATLWKDYLQDITRTYGNEPALAGYAFDDSFGDSTVSYGAFEQKAFGGPLPQTTNDPNWQRWTELRNGWWEDWAIDTVKYIRDIDVNTNHVIYIEDYAASVTNAASHARNGLDLRRVAQHFDAVCGYTTPGWTSAPDSRAKAIQLTEDAIRYVRQAVGPEKPIIYTFWSANILEERKRGPAQHPTAAELKDLCDAAMKMGVTHLDMYGYRIGDSDVTPAEMKRRMPSEPAPYILSGQFSQKYLWDRPEIHTGLGEYLNGLNSTDLAIPH